MINYKDELNPQQHLAVTEGDGPCLVLAGAGSGKTRTITYRVAYLLEKGINPDNILLLTFTNKAAKEMVDRVKKLTGQEFKLPFGGTFHSIANKILRRYAKKVGYGNNFTIIDSDDSRALIKLCIKEFKPDSGQKFPSAKVVQNVLSYARNAQLPLEDILRDRYEQYWQFAPNFGSISSAYERRKKEGNVMDFDDLLVNWLLLLNQPEMLEKFSTQFKYVLVDEYQDTNKIQAAIIQKVSSKHNNLLVVGDDAQSIYSFRAAEIKNILDFEKNHQDTKIFRLETNYRSSKEILDVANEVISNNVKQYPKELRTDNLSGVRPVLEPQDDQSSEARFIVRKIKQKIEAGVPHKEVAVLFRAAFHSQILEMELVKNSINYEYRGGLRFFERAHIKDVLAYLRILNNLTDSAAWLRLLMHEDGIGPVGAQKIISKIQSVGSVEEISEISYEGLKGTAKQGWHNFVMIWNQLVEADKNDVASLITIIKDSSYQNYLQAEYTDAKDRLDDIEQLAVFAQSAENLDDFLAEASLQENFSARQMNIRSANDNTRDENKIILSTIHQAKGLEWDNVFIISLANGKFPSEYAWKERDGIEEERRLFYVALTRAKKNLYLTYPEDSGNWSAGGPSIFIEEIPSDLLEGRSFLGMSTVLDDPDAGVTYVDEYEDQPKIRPGSFLVDVDDL